MATNEGSVVERSKDLTTEDLHDFLNIFSSEFNCCDIHDRVLCFEIIKDEKLAMKDYSEGDITCGNITFDDKDANTTGQRLTETTSVQSTQIDGPKTSLPLIDDELSSFLLNQVNVVEVVQNKEDSAEIGYTAKTKQKAQKEIKQTTEEITTDKTSELKETVQNSSKIDVDEQELRCQVEDLEDETECDENDTEGNVIEAADDEDKSTLSKLFVHSQWLAVQSPYFKALFYSGMKETYSKEVIMKIHEHELQAHQTLIEAMYRLDVLSDKDYRLVVQVFLLAHKYDARHVFKKCKCVLLSTTPSLEMCEYILGKIEDLSDTADIYDVLEEFLVKEFTPIDDTWTLTKFTSLSEAALRLLLKSDQLSTRSENTIFVALMKWVRTNTTLFLRKKCDLLDLAKFEFMSANFLYDVVRNHFVACQMPGFQQCLLSGLAYHAFSQTRREQLEPKPKKRPVLADANPTFSWVIDEKLLERLTSSLETSVFSDKFWYKGYPMQLHLYFSEDLNKCGFFFAVRELKGKACLYSSYTAKSDLFAKRTIRIAKHLFTNEEPDWGFKSLDRNKTQTGKCFTIEIWVEIYE